MSQVDTVEYWKGRAEAAWRREDKQGMDLIRLRGEVARLRRIEEAVMAWATSSNREQADQMLLDARVKARETELSDSQAGE